MSKPIKIMMTTIIALTLVGVVAIIVLLYTDDSTNEASEPTIDEKVENSFLTEEITTDLADNNFVRIQFRIVTDSKAASEYLQKGESFQLNNVIIKALTVKESDDFRSGLDQIEENIKMKLNQILDEGLVTGVFVTDKVLQ
ncbi:flagellar basal body-associated FliL family protein [Filobacillus milosensis]|nr:flagellar basal body-associated FliL family protein [Filobacillus milosensis]